MTPRLTPEQLGAVDDLAAAWRLSERLEPFAELGWTGEGATTSTTSAGSRFSTASRGWRVNTERAQGLW